MTESKPGSSRVILSLLLIALFICPLLFMPVRFSYILPRKTFTEIMLCLIITVAFASGAFRLRKSPFFIPWLLFLGVSFISIFQAPHFFMGWKTFFFFAVMATLCAAAPQFSFLKKNPIPLFIAILVPGLINSFYCFLQYAGVDFNFLQSMRFTAFGTLGSPAMLAGYLAVCLVICLHLYVQANTRYKRWMWLFFNIVIIAAIIITGSRAGILSFLTGGAVYTFFKHSVPGTGPRVKKGYMIAFLIIAPVGASLIAIQSLPQKGENPFKALPLSRGYFSRQKAESVVQRKLIWTAAADLISERPITGHGAGTFAFEYPKAQARVLADEEKRSRFYDVAVKRLATYTHNDYLQIACEMGIPGLFAIMLFPLFALSSFLKVLKTKDDFSVKHGPAAAAIVVTIGFQALVDFSLYMPASALCGWLFLGIMAKGSEAGSPPPFLIRIPVYVTAGVFILVSTLPLTAVIMLSQSRRHIAGGDLQAAVQKLEAAKRIDPAEPAISGELGLIARRTGNFQEAKIQYDDALMVSTHPTHYFGRGAVEYILSNLEAAEEDFKTVLSIDPSTISAMGALGVIYFETERYDMARTMFESVLEEEPDNTASKRYMHDIAELSNNEHDSAPDE
ncbi:O-antigen ligase family protein [bacterium]